MSSKIKKLDVLKCVLNWLKNNEAVEDEFDMQDLANLAQSLGFYITYIDQCYPEETTPLQNNKKGIRLIMSCNYSGFRFYLEKPVEKDICNCPQVCGADESIYIPACRTNASAFSSNENDEIISKLLMQVMPIKKQSITKTWNDLKQLPYTLRAKPLSASSRISSEENFSTASSFSGMERYESCTNLDCMYSARRKHFLLGDREHLIYEAHKNLSQFLSLNRHFGSNSETDSVFDEQVVLNKTSAKVKDLVGLSNSLQPAFINKDKTFKLLPEPINGRNRLGSNRKTPLRGQQKGQTTKNLGNTTTPKVAATPKVVATSFRDQAKTPLTNNSNLTGTKRKTIISNASLRNLKK